MYTVDVTVKLNRIFKVLYIVKNYYINYKFILILHFLKFFIKFLINFLVNSFNNFSLFYKCKWK